MNYSLLAIEYFLQYCQVASASEAEYETIKKIEYYFNNGMIETEQVFHATIETVKGLSVLIQKGE